MRIMRFEWRLYRRSTIIWALTLSVSMMAFLPVYYGMFTGAGGAVFDTALLEDNPVIGAMIPDFELLFEPVGMYIFLHSFVVVAGAVQAMSLGMSVFLEEFKQNTSDFLYTKPYSRGRVYLEKLAAVLLCLGITGISYFAASYIAMKGIADASVSWKVFALVSGSFLLIQLFFAAAGLFIAVIFSGTKSVLLLSMAAAFAAYVAGAFSEKVNVPAIGWLSPYKYFDSGYIAANGHYDILRVIIIMAVCVILYGGGLIQVTKKDI